MRNRAMSVLGSLGMALGACAAAGAQTVEFRIVERQGQTSVPVPVGTTATTDAVLNFAVQARVVGGAANTALGNFRFNVHIVNEPEANGTLAKMLISNSDGTYAANPNQSLNATVGRGGLARPYSFLAGIGPNFNGLINIGGASFTNTPDQEIGIITGSPTGQAMLDVTDLNGDGNPDTYVGPVAASPGATAALDPALANTYFAANGNWIDVYRFRYTVGATSTARFLHFTLDWQAGSVSAEVFNGWILSNGVWGPVQNSANVVVTGLDLAVGNPSGACCQRNLCMVLDRPGCEAGHGQFRGDGAACLPAGATNACCVGNYNGENGLGVQDIFDFLSSWFSGDLRSDIDENGVLNVYDIFAFLGAWRNGC